VILLQLFLVFLKIGLFSFGGGYGTIALIEREVVVSHGWITVERFLQLVTVAEMTPGPIGLNSATFVGCLVGGIPGGIAATAAAVLPPFAVILALTALLRRYMEREERLAARFFELMRPFALSLILAAAVAVGRTSVVDWRTALIALGAFGLTVRFRINVILVVFGAGILGVVLGL